MSVAAVFVTVVAVLDVPVGVVVVVVMTTGVGSFVVPTDAVAGVFVVSFVVQVVAVVETVVGTPVVPVSDFVVEWAAAVVAGVVMLEVCLQTIAGQGWPTLWCPTLHLSSVSLT